MNSKNLHGRTSRYEGCTVMGVLSVSAFLTDAVTLIHGPDGCTHINTSLLYSTLAEHDIFRIPEIVSTGLGEDEIIFGGEDALEDALTTVCGNDPAAVVVASTCVSETIGDDVAGICSQSWDVPVIYVPSSGFLGGTFTDGYTSTLTALSSFIAPPSCWKKNTGTVNIVGEKNLEFEAEDNFQEVSRILGLLGLDVNIRYVRDITVEDIGIFGDAELNLFREDKYGILGRHFDAFTGIPSLPEFPVGLSATLDFIRDVGRLTGRDTTDAVSAEEEQLAGLTDEFSDLRGEYVTFDSFGFQSAEMEMFTEVAEAVGIRVSEEGTVIPIPFCMPVGTLGLRRMLRQWRRFIDG
ncbi:nitrogenase component 1 [Methanogenium marinum]|uniref:Nitrogenase component 1 n=1 Tax=Methanogenium marinum TaxID=348610 RepID=A0A9Q4PX09_9EURY|nr:nitrogenase component 1 [Methanogenium marinum]MDE4908036.1 nitrogenase component 1 [Methanogenium marinum]